MDTPVERDKPWRPADHPAPGPSWETRDLKDTPEHRGTPDAED
ncbi:MAG: hypothetical protein ABI401_12795 [Candidatus Dormibacter sp.]